MKIIKVNILTFFMLISMISCKVLSNKENVKENKITDSIHNDTIELIQYKNIYNEIYHDEIFKKNIKTVLCKTLNQQLSIPMINLNSEDKLLISFDDLGKEKKEYYLKIIHCNSNWSKSDLDVSEYISGFTNEPIIDYEFSFNTVQQYTHYKIEFPNDNIRPLISGNYILQIYEEENGIIAQKRFMILDSKVNIETNVRKATLAENRHTKHEVDLIIRHPNLLINDPFNDIKVTIKQNNLEHSQINNLKPLFVKNNELVYDYEDDNTFWGNNEFRNFDITSLRYFSERIKNITYKENNNHVFLFPDQKRSFDNYTIKPDINGKFIIKSKEGWDSNIEADYAWVYFNLNADSITYGDLYLIGELSNWRIQDDFKLLFNKQNNKYEASIYLKQGYYNYYYALKDRSTQKTDITFIEGTHYETKNDYFIYIYHRSVGDKYDQLIGFLKSSSKELF